MCNLLNYIKSSVISQVWVKEFKNHEEISEWFKYQKQVYKETIQIF